jgi:hypothetical protein
MSCDMFYSPVLEDLPNESDFSSNPPSTSIIATVRNLNTHAVLRGAQRERIIRVYGRAFGIFFARCSGCCTSLHLVFKLEQHSIFRQTDVGYSLLTSPLRVCAIPDSTRWWHIVSTKEAITQSFHALHLRRQIAVFRRPQNVKQVPAARTAWVSAPRTTV